MATIWHYSDDKTRRYFCGNRYDLRTYLSRECVVISDSAAIVVHEIHKESRRKPDTFKFGAQTYNAREWYTETHHS